MINEVQKRLLLLKSELEQVLAAVDEWVDEAVRKNPMGMCVLMQAIIDTEEHEEFIRNVSLDMLIFICRLALVGFANSLERIFDREINNLKEGDGS